MSTKKRWVRNVKTVSTFPPQGLFTKDAATIARAMASKKVSPKGLCTNNPGCQRLSGSREAWHSGILLGLHRRNRLAGRGLAAQGMLPGTPLVLAKWPGAGRLEPLCELFVQSRPKGIGSGIRMIQFFMNRAGKGLPAARRHVLEKAKQLLQARAKKGKA